jgi:hypothetical protein
MDPFSRHRCMIYDGAPSVHLSVIAGAAIERFIANYRCFYLNSPAMVAGLRSVLAASGVDVVDATARGALVLSSDQSHLVDGEFDVERMLALLEKAVEQALSDGFGGLWASGDMLWEFGSEKNLDKLLAYELALDQLLKQQPALCGICQYHRDVLPADAVRVGLYTHQTIHVNEMLPRLNPQYRQAAALHTAWTDAKQVTGRI